MFTPAERKQLAYVNSFVGTIAMLKPYVELLIQRPITIDELDEVLKLC